jgi:hypothetical protein
LTDSGLIVTHGSFGPVERRLLCRVRGRDQEGNVMKQESKGDPGGGKVGSDPKAARKVGGKGDFGHDLHQGNVTRINEDDPIDRPAGGGQRDRDRSQPQVAHGRRRLARAG